MSASSNMEVATTGDTTVAPENVQENGDVSGQGQQQQQSQGSSYWSILKGILFRALIVYLITSLFRRPQQATNQGAVSDGNGAPVADSRIPSSNLFINGTIMDIYMFVSEEELHVDFKDPKSLLWKIPNVIYGDWYGGPDSNSMYTLETTVEAPLNIQNNGSFWLHVFLVKGGMSPDPEDKRKHLRMFTVHKYKRLNRYKKRRYLQTHNLLTGKTSASAEAIEKSKYTPVEILSHWHPNLTINIVDDHTPWIQGHVPPPLDEYVEFEPTTGKYYPIVYMNDYWNLLRDYTPVNETTKHLPLFLTFQPLTLFRWQMYTAQAIRSRWASMLGQDMMEESEEEQDSLKEALLETSPYLLGLTFVVSIVHSVFEFLAFKNDIQFWKNRKSLEGLSVRSVFFNVFQSLVVLLYVMDNDTNMMVRLSVFVGLGIEIWKIHKVTSIKINRENRIFGFLPRISFQDKGSYVDSSTKQYDLLAFRYLSWALFPLLGCYAVYSLLYVEHKGWYSWVLSMLYGFLLTFGFIMMTPQLFINYKLKSVAHLPWRMLTYKFLNTFIDDIFAFVIKMPTMYRLGCFRDDIIFLIFLYQRWIYRVDPKRVNEFGTSGEMDTTSPSTEGEITATAGAITATAGAITANGEVPETANGTIVSDKKND